MLAEKVAANESLHARQAELGLTDGERLPFLCECDDVTCRAVIRLTTHEYTAVRRIPGRCVCVPGHPAAGRVVATDERYVIVEA